MAHYNTVFHTLAKIHPRHEIDRLASMTMAICRTSWLLLQAKYMRSMWAKSLDYQPGSMICMDRGYTDYDWWEDLTQSGRLSYFLNGLSRI